MRIALIYAGIARIGWNSFNRLGPEDEESFYVPSGLMYIKAVLEAAGEYQVDTLDFRLLQGSEEFEQKLVEGRYDIACVSFLSPSRDYGVLAGRIAKRLGITAIAGGVHASAVPEDLVESGQFDSVVVGEGELSILEIVEIVKNGEELPPIYRTVYFVKDLDTLPFPAKAYSPTYDHAFDVNGRTAHIVAGRGCPGRCRFCFDKRLLYGRNALRLRTPENVVSEMIYLRDHFGIEAVGFSDDTFTWNKRWLRRFRDCVKEVRGRLPRIGLSTRADVFDEEIAQILREVGCHAIWFGFESASPRILDVINKGCTVEQNRQAARICKEFGFDLNVNLLVGVPGETEEDYLLTYRFLEEIHPVHVRYNVLTPYPGSDYYRDLASNGLLRGLGWEATVLQQMRDRGGVIKDLNYDTVKKWRGPFLAFDRIGRLEKQNRLWMEKEDQLNELIQSIGVSKLWLDRMFRLVYRIISRPLVQGSLKALSRMICAMRRSLV